MDTQPTATQIIAALGGPSATARIFGIRPQSVSGWMRAGIPDARLMYLKLARPDVFGNDRRGKRRRPAKDQS